MHLATSFAHAAALLLCICLSSQTGCKKKAAPTNKTISLVRDGEVAELRTTFAAIASGNAAKICKRPRLRDTPLIEGSADKDMLALLATDGAMQSCYAELEKVQASIEDEDGVLSLLVDSEGRARAIGDKVGLTAEQVAYLASLEERCAQLPEIVSRAVSHEDACSPYLPGRRALEDVVPFLEMSKAAVVVSRKLAMDGKKLEAMQLLLDSVRFGQDLSRGGTPLLEPIAAYKSHETIRAELDRQAESLSLDELRVIEAEMTLLIASQPHHATYLEGERNLMVMNTVWPALEAEGWQPPGGFPDGQAEYLALSQEGGPPPEDAAVLTWTVVQNTAEKDGQACSESVPLRACILAMDELRDAWSKKAKPDLQLAMTLFKTTIVADESTRVALRQEMVDILQAVATPDYSTYFLLIESTRIALLAEQNKIQSLIAAKEGKPCPLPLPFAASDAELLPRVIAQGDDIELRLPQWMIDRAVSDAQKEELSLTLVQLRCS